MGGNLVAVQSSIENAYVAGIVAATTKVQSFWIGANYLMSNSWSWTQPSTSFNYSNSAPGQPSDPSMSQCVAVGNKNNYWT